MKKLFDIQLGKSTYKELEAIIVKVADTHNITDVDKIVLDISPKTCVAYFRTIFEGIKGKRSAMDK